MKKLSLLIVTMIFAGALAAQSNVKMAQVKEVEHLNGLYTGTLSYLDYTSNERVEIPLTGNCYLKSDDLFLEFTINEWGKVFHQKYKYSFKNGTIYADGAWNLEKDEYDPETKAFTYLITKSGRDGNERKPCTFRVKMAYANDTLTITKDVKFDDEDAFFNRNEYKITRLR